MKLGPDAVNTNDVIDWYIVDENNDHTQLQAGFVIYATDALFQSASLQNNQDEEGSLVDVAGPVLSVLLDDNTLNNLQEPLVITFKVSFKRLFSN